MGVKGGAIQLVTQSTRQIQGNVAIPVHGFTTAERTIRGGPALPVYIVSDAEIAAGTFRVQGGDAMPVALSSGVGAVRVVQGGPAIPIYAVNGIPSAGSPPAAPTLLTAVQNGADIDLSWTDNATDETGYKIYRSSDGVSYSEIDDIAADSTSYTDLNPGGGVWWYYVAAYNSAGESGSNVASINMLLEMMLSFNPTTLWPLVETSGTQVTDVSGNGLHGVYAGSVSLSNIIGPDGVNRQTLWPDTGLGVANVYSAGLNSAWTPDLFSVVAWTKSLNWGDAVTRYVWQLAAGGSDFTWFQKLNSANFGRPVYTAGGIGDKVDWSTVKTAEWYMLTLTVDVAGDAMKFYVNNAQLGATQTGLGTWAGALSSTSCVLGNASSTGTIPWAGWIGYVGMYFNQILSLANIQAIYAAGNPPLP